MILRSYDAGIWVLGNTDRYTVSECSLNENKNPVDVSGVGHKNAKKMQVGNTDHNVNLAGYKDNSQNDLATWIGERENYAPLDMVLQTKIGVGSGYMIEGVPSSYEMSDGKGEVQTFTANIETSKVRASKFQAAKVGTPADVDSFLPQFPIELSHIVEDIDDVSTDPALFNPIVYPQGKDSADFAVIVRMISITSSGITRIEMAEWQPKIYLWLMEGDSTAQVAVEGSKQEIAYYSEEPNLYMYDWYSWKNFNLTENVYIGFSVESSEPLPSGIDPATASLTINFSAGWFQAYPNQEFGQGTAGNPVRRGIKKIGVN